MNIKKVILMGRKNGASQAIEYLYSRGIIVSFFITTDSEKVNPQLHATAEKYNIKVEINGNSIYDLISRSDKAIQDIDLVVSYLYPEKILAPLYLLSRHGCINFHPAPLPEYKSRAGYNTAILNQDREFGVSVHYIDSEKFDSGPIIRVLRFPIDSIRETAYSLEQKAQAKLIELFRITIDQFLDDMPIQTIANIGGLYLTSKQLDAMKNIDLTCDSPEEIHRKCRAFFFPPYTGARLKIDEHEFTLINNDILDYINFLFHKQS